MIVECPAEVRGHFYDLEKTFSRRFRNEMVGGGRVVDLESNFLKAKSLFTYYQKAYYTFSDSVLVN